MSQSMTEPKIIRIAVLALGGQGGGVLIDWIVALAENAGWTAQSTSVAGVAQRTGATIYYVEIIEPTPGKFPVMALMPVPGDVDIVIAAELMEAGRAVDRGLVTSDKTVLIASSHRTYSVHEKIVPGNGIAQSAPVIEVLHASAKRLVIADMQELAVRNGSVISASLFGALAGSDALPFERSQFEEVVEKSGVGVQASIRSLRAAYELSKNQASRGTPLVPESSMETAPRKLPEQASSPLLQSLVSNIRNNFPEAAWDWLGEGVARVVDWQDVGYGEEYLDIVLSLIRLADGTPEDALVVEAARWIAVAMSYDDVIRVADIKTRLERSQRIRSEVAASAHDVFGTEEYFHPGLDEVIGLLPLPLANWIESGTYLKKFLRSRLERGRRIQSQSLFGHLQLRAVASLRHLRRGNHRHHHEMAHMKNWLSLVRATLPVNPMLATEMLRCRQLVKGYSDTHARGSSRFDKLMNVAGRMKNDPNAAMKLAYLRNQALADADALRFESKLNELAV